VASNEQEVEMVRTFSVGVRFGVAAIVAVVVAAGVPAAGQTPGTRAKAANTSAVSRTADGHPDIQGTWSFATLTPLERPAAFAGKEVLTAEEAAKLEDQAVQTQEVEPAPRAGDPGGYNRFWLDSPTKVIGTKRTSLIVDPPDGKVPALTPQGEKRQATRHAARQAAANPEDLPVYERCILGFNSGPPIIPGGYNQNIQLFQTRDYVVIHHEMVHDARIVPLDGRSHLPAQLRQWRGDSRGRWEGDTLVVTTKNFTSMGTGTLRLDPAGPRAGLGSADENATLIERFRRVDADTLSYEFTITDPTVWTKPWTVSLPMTKSQEPVYEYACHEGNYGMKNILSGARAAEKAAEGARTESEGNRR
jgi:hypothetical protein